MIDVILLTLPVWAHATPGLGPGLLKSFVQQSGYPPVTFSIKA